MTLRENVGQPRSSNSVKMIPSYPEVVIAGPFLDHDLFMAEALSSRGFDCVVLRFAHLEMPNPDRLQKELRYFSLDRVIAISSSLQSLAILRRAKCIITYSGLLVSFLHYFWLLFPILRLPPIINLTTGSDITEWATQKNRGAFFYRQLLRRVAFTVISPYPAAIDALRRLKLPRYVFLRYPHLLPEPQKSTSRRIDEIVFAHLSNLDWGVSDNKPGRNSTKGNDRFLRAFASALKEGAPIRCKILDRGPDRIVARQLIESLGVAEYFEWIEPVEPSKLPALFSEIDVVVDQFDVGGFGGIALEAMSCSKPVMTYLDPACSSLIYDNKPPILNCSSEAQIHEMILGNLDRAVLRNLGERARKWVLANHGTEHNMEEFICRMCIAAGFQWPRPY